MIKAAAMGVVNFSDAQLLDRSWWRRLNWLLGEVEATEAKQLIQLKFQQHSSALNYLAGQQTFDHHWNVLNKLHTKWLELATPWLPSGAESNDQLKAKWRQAHAHLSDEELKQREAEMVAAMKETRGPEKDWTKNG